MSINVQDALKQMGNRPVPYTDVNEAKRIRPIKGLWTPKQMYTQVARTKKAAFELRQHADFIFQMDADVGPSMSRNSGLYMDVYDKMTAALDQFDQAIKEELGLSSELRLEYFETRDLGGGRSVDIYEVYGMPDTFIGVSEGSSDILIITL